MLFFLAVIAAVDRYQDLLRLSASYPANENRLGKNEAPPTIISVFVGTPLEKLIERLSGFSRSCMNSPVDMQQSSQIALGVDSFPKIPLDNTDRNRTSPFAFTGNKFEFRMVGSSQSIGMPNTVINTATAQVLGEIADELDRVKAKAVQSDMSPEEVS